MDEYVLTIFRQPKISGGGGQLPFYPLLLLEVTALEYDAALLSFVVSGGPGSVIVRQKLFKNSKSCNFIDNTTFCLLLLTF